MKQFDISRMARDNFASHTGIKPVQVEEGASLVVLEIEERHLNLFGYVSGGVIFALADTALGLAVATEALRRKTSLATVEAKISFLRGVKSGRLEAQGKALRITGQLATVEASVRSGETEIARALGTVAILPLTEEVKQAYLHGRSGDTGSVRPL